MLLTATRRLRETTSFCACVVTELLHVSMNTKVLYLYYKNKEAQAGKETFTLKKNGRVVCYTSLLFVQGPTACIGLRLCMAAELDEAALREKWSQPREEMEAELEAQA